MWSVILLTLRIMCQWSQKPQLSQSEQNGPSDFQPHMRRGCESNFVTVLRMKRRNLLIFWRPLVLAIVIALALAIWLRFDSQVVLINRHTYNVSLGCGGWGDCGGVGVSWNPEKMGDVSGVEMWRLRCACWPPLGH